MEKRFASHRRAICFGKKWAELAMVELGMPYRSTLNTRYAEGKI